MPYDALLFWTPICLIVFILKRYEVAIPVSCIVHFWVLPPCKSNCAQQVGGMSRRHHAKVRFLVCQPVVLECFNLSIWVFPKIMVPPNHPFVHRVFHYNPSILFFSPICGYIHIFTLDASTRLGWGPSPRHLVTPEGMSFVYIGWIHIPLIDAICAMVNGCQWSMNSSCWSPNKAVVNKNLMVRCVYRWFRCLV